jgi:hypothetical protein
MDHLYKMNSSVVRSAPLRPSLVHIDFADDDTIDAYLKPAGRWHNGRTTDICRLRFGPSDER